MMNEEAILVWIEENLNENSDVIEDLSHVQIKQMVQQCSQTSTQCACSCPLLGTPYLAEH